MDELIEKLMAVSVKITFDRDGDYRKVSLERNNNGTELSDVTAGLALNNATAAAVKAGWLKDKELA